MNTLFLYSLYLPSIARATAVYIYKFYHFVRFFVQKLFNEYLKANASEIESFLCQN